MENIMQNEELNFIDNNSPDKPVLGVLEGPCADFMSATRNGRKYPESLWEKVFSDPIVTELIENGGIPGELDHPADREETDSSRIAIMMTEKPAKKNGKLWAKFSILNTPLGKIAYTLAKAGFKLGISSRGSGEVFTDDTGSEVVDEDTYDFKAFDLVLVPAVKSARLNLVTESLDTNKFDYKKALKESLDNATEEDKKLMEDTLSNLDISLDNNVEDSEKSLNIDDSEDTVAVDNNEANVLDELQENLKKIKELESKIIGLNEKLSVCYTKEAQQEDLINNQKIKIKKLQESSNISKTTITNLRNKLSQLNKTNSKLDAELLKNNKSIKTINENFDGLKDNYKSVIDKYNSLVDVYNEVKEENQSLTESVESLKEELTDSKKNLEIKTKQYSQGIEKSNQLVEKYRKVANNAADRYIESQAVRIGVKPQEIKNKLSEKFTFDEIDSICEDLQSYKLSVSKLPFQTNRQLNENIKSVDVKPSKRESLIDGDELYDDNVDDLLKIINI